MKLSELKTIIELMEMSLSEDISDKARASKAIERLKKAEATFREKMYKFDDVLQGKVSKDKTNKPLSKELKEGRYHDWRNDESLTPKQKIGKSIREVRDSLNELDKTINMNLKLKTELQVDSRDYWKTTHKALKSISEKLVRLAGKVGNLK